MPVARSRTLEKQLRRLGTPREKLEAKYGRLPGSSASARKFMLKLTYPNQGTKQRSKYAAVLVYVREHKKPDQSVKEFVRANRGINRCLEGKRLRDKKKCKASDTK